MSTEFYWIAVAAVTVLSAARLTRLAVYDDFPPVAWVRDRYESKAPGKWKLLALCGFCASFWVTLAVVLWGWLTDFNEVWWIINAVFGASYLAASYVARDGDED